MGLRMIGDAVWFDIFGHRLVHIALAQLRITHPRPMTNQLMSERPAHASDEKIPDRMLQDGTVTYFQDMLDIGLVATGPWLGKTHVTNTAGNLHQVLTSNLGIGLPGNAMIRQKTVHFSLIGCLPA